MKHILILLAFAAGAAQAQHSGHAPATPYAGLQGREIKALSPDDTAKLLQGQGMSLALAAELNGYPGPSHVLELAQPLQLSEAQRAQTQALMDAHKAEARELGRQLVEAERALDALFARGQASAADVAQHTRRIGELQGTTRSWWRTTPAGAATPRPNPEDPCDETFHDSACVGTGRPARAGPWRHAQGAGHSRAQGAEALGHRR